MEKLEIVDLNMVYYSLKGATEALKSINLTVKEREFVTIVGPSGCGKSTLLSMVAGLIKPTGGKILLDGVEVTGPSLNIGYMLQQDHLFRQVTLSLPGSRLPLYLSRW